MEPLIKYPGGKNKEINIIKKFLPNNIINYYEPFFGGGAVFFELDLGNKKFINDKSTELINFYRKVKEQSKEFYDELYYLNGEFKNAAIKVRNRLDEYKAYYYLGWDFEEQDELTKKTIIQKIDHIRKKSKEDGELKQFSENIEAAIKQSIFNRARNEYNAHSCSSERMAALFVFMRQYAFSGMFRYNSRGEFNVPYGGIAYNDKYLDDRIEKMKSNITQDMFARTTIENKDFYDFLNSYEPQGNDFVFLDPPYDTDFSSYGNMEFGKKDQMRLADYLINSCQGKWMVVIKATDFIRKLYPAGFECKNGTINIFEFDKQYDVCIRGRNNKRCEHLVITNYSV